MGPGAGAMASVVAGAPLWRQQDRRGMGSDGACGRAMGYVVELYCLMAGSATYKQTNKYGMKLCCPHEVSLFTLFIQSLSQREFIVFSLLIFLAPKPNGSPFLGCET